jgi:hypothetical protein
MVSSTQQFERIRKRKATTNGKRNKRERRAVGPPAFPVHPVGYERDGGTIPRAMHDERAEDRGMRAQKHEERERDRRDEDMRHAEPVPPSSPPG